MNSAITHTPFIYVPLVIFFALMGPHPNDGVKKARKGPYTQLI